MRKALDAGKSINDAGIIALLHLISSVTNTNLIARSDLDTQRQAARQLQDFLDGCPFPDQAAARELDTQFIEKNLFPGGCADLLSICYFLLFLGKDHSARFYDKSADPHISDRKY